MQQLQNTSISVFLSAAILAGANSRVNLLSTKFMEKKNHHSGELKNAASAGSKGLSESNGAYEASGASTDDLHTKRQQTQRPLYTVESSDFPRIQQICLKIDENFKKSVFSIKHPDYKTAFRNLADFWNRY